MVREAPGGPEASHSRSSMLQDMSGDPLLGLVHNSDKGLKVIETEGSPIAPRAGLILEWAGEGRCDGFPVYRWKS